MTDVVPNVATEATPVAENAPVNPVVETTAPVATQEISPIVTEKPVDAPAQELKPLLSADIEPLAPVEQQPVTLEPEFVAPTFQDFNIPEGVSVDKELMGEFTKELAEFAVNTKAPAEEVQKFGQQLIDRHIKEVQTAVERHTQTLVAEWEARKANWYEDFKKDPEIGGNRQDTTIKQSKEFLKTHIPNPEILAGFYKALEETGGNYHPGILKGLWSIANSRQFRAPEPVLATKPVAEKTKYEKRYGTN